MNSFPIHAYSKQELAMLYFPTASTAHVAVNHLVAWIKRCTPLAEELHNIGYKKTAKFFNSKEVALIVQYIGEP